MKSRYGAHALVVGEPGVTAIGAPRSWNRGYWASTLTTRKVRHLATPLGVDSVLPPRNEPRGEPPCIDEASVVTRRMSNGVVVVSGAAAGDGHASRRQRSAPHRVLVVDNDRYVLRVLTSVIESLGHEARAPVVA